jgi:hypothetical protein
MLYSLDTEKTSLNNPQKRTGPKALISLLASLSCFKFYILLCLVSTKLINIKFNHWHN